MASKLCPVCGKGFVPANRHPKQKYCSRKCYKKQYAQNHRKEIYKRNYKWEKNHPLAKRAHRYVQYHKVPFAKHCIWPGCYVTERLERHHPDYSRPGVVVTLCHKHHALLHANKIKFEEEFRRKVEEIEK